MKKLLVVILVIIMISISSIAFAYPSTNYTITSGIIETEGDSIWWFKGYGYLWGDDNHYYDLAVELWDEGRNNILAQGNNTGYEDVTAVSNKGYDYNPELIYVDLPWVDLGT